MKLTQFNKILIFISKFHILNRQLKLHNVKLKKLKFLSIVHLWSFDHQKTNQIVF